MGLSDKGIHRALVAIRVSTSRVFPGQQGKARCTGNGYALARQRTNPPGADLNRRRQTQRGNALDDVRHTALTGQGQPNAKVILTRGHST